MFVVLRVITIIIIIIIIIIITIYDTNIYIYNSTILIIFLRICTDIILGIYVCRITCNNNNNNNNNNNFDTSDYLE